MKDPKQQTKPTKRGPSNQPTTKKNLEHPDAVRQKFHDEYIEVFDAYAMEKSTEGTTLAAPDVAMALASFVVRYLETLDRQFLDTALEYCYAKELPVQRPLLRHIVAAIENRRKIEGKTTVRAVREGVRNKAFTIMGKLVILGLTLERAAEVASVWSQNSPHPQRASTLEKGYVKAWRSGNPTTESVMREFRNTEPNPDHDAAFLAWANGLRRPTPEEKGERR